MPKLFFLILLLLLTFIILFTPGDPIINDEMPTQGIASGVSETIQIP